MHMDRKRKYGNITNPKSTISAFGMSVAQIHPLLIPLIIGKTFQNLRVNDLLNVRLVCKAWEYEARKIVVKARMYVGGTWKIRAGEIKTTTLEHYLWHGNLNNRIRTSIRHFALADIDHRDVNLARFLNIFGHQLRSLEITTSQGSPTWPLHIPSSKLYFWNILRKLPYLTHIYFDLAIWNRLTHLPNMKDPANWLDLKSLTCFELVSQTSWSRTCSARFFWVDSPNWQEEPIWFILLAILRSAPNLQILNTEKGNCLPRYIVDEIFNNPPFKLKVLVLGRDDSDLFYDFLISNPAILGLVKLSLYRPGQASPQDWDSLFKWVGPTLVNLDLGNVEVRRWEMHPTLPLAREKARLDEIQFRIQMPNLEMMILNLSMLNFTTSNPFCAMNELILTIFKQNLIDWVAQLESGILLTRPDVQGSHLYSSIRKLTLHFFLDSRSLPDIRKLYAPFFKVLAQYLPNLEELDLMGSLGIEGLKAFLEVYANSAVAAENVRVLRIMEFIWSNPMEARGFIFLNRPAEFEHSTLECFAGLKKLCFGFQQFHCCAEVAQRFIWNSIRPLHQLNTLELRNLTVRKETEDNFKSVPNLKHLRFIDCVVSEPDSDSDELDSNSEKSDSDSEELQSDSDSTESDSACKESDSGSQDSDSACKGSDSDSKESDSDSNSEQSVEFRTLGRTMSIT